MKLRDIYPEAGLRGRNKHINYFFPIFVGV